MLADHHLDSIYFLGFLYTLVSLAVFFLEVQIEETFNKLDLFLRERAESSERLREVELRQSKSLEELAGATEALARRLTEAQEQLGSAATGVSAQVNNLSRTVRELQERAAGAGESMEQVKVELNGLPITQVSVELERFGGGVDELNLVLDSLLEIMDKKVGSLV